MSFKKNLKIRVNEIYNGHEHPYREKRSLHNSFVIQLSGRREHLPIGIILLLSFSLNITGVTWGLPNYVDWALDTIVPFDMLEGAYHRFSHGWANIYPPFAYIIQAALCAPYIGYLMLSGGLNAPNPIFPFGLSDPLSALTNIILISRILSVFMGVGIVLLVYLTVCELFDRQSALFSALIVTFSYPFIYYAHNANADIPYLFWAFLAVYYFVRLLKKDRLRHYVLFALFGTLAICTKDQAYGLFLLSPLPILWAHFTKARCVAQGGPNWSRLLRDRRFLVAGLVAVGTFLLAQNIFFNFTGFLNHVRLITGEGSVPYAKYAPTLLGRLELLWTTVSRLAMSLTAPLFVLSLIGSVYCAFKFPRYSLPLLFLAASYYVTFINVVGYVPLRFVLPIGIIIAFFGGKLLSEVWQQGPWQKLRRVAICVAYAYAALFAVQLDLLLLRDPRYAAEEWLQERLKPGDLIETFSPSDTFFKHYPRFPIWVKVRSSKLQSGTQWEIRETEHKMLPNLYTGREPPEYIVLSKFSYGGLLALKAEHSDEARVLNDLFEGRTDYSLAATFETPTLVPIDGLSINSRIDIFARSH